METKIGAADDAWVSYASEINTKFLIVVFSQELIKYFAHTVNSFWLQYRIIWSIFFLEVWSTKDSNA